MYFSEKSIKLKAKSSFSTVCPRYTYSRKALNSDALVSGITITEEYDSSIPLANIVLKNLHLSLRIYLWAGNCWSSTLKRTSDSNLLRNRKAFFLAGSSVVLKTLRKVFSEGFDENKLVWSNPGFWTDKLDFFIEENRLFRASSSPFVSLDTDFWNEKFGLFVELEPKRELADEESKLFVELFVSWTIDRFSVFFIVRKRFSVFLRLESNKEFPDEEKRLFVVLFVSWIVDLSSAFKGFSAFLNKLFGAWENKEDERVFSEFWIATVFGLSAFVNKPLAWLAWGFWDKAGSALGVWPLLRSSNFFCFPSNLSWIKILWKRKVVHNFLFWVNLTFWTFFFFGRRPPFSSFGLRFRWNFVLWI